MTDEREELKDDFAIREYMVLTDPMVDTDMTLSPHESNETKRFGSRPEWLLQVLE